MNQCSKCGSDNFSEIIYGYIKRNQEINQAIKEKKIQLGGYIISDQSPKFQCNECQFKWGSIEYD